MAIPQSCCRSSRSDLLSLLSQACELEHALACSYLFTSFTLKQDIREGLNFRQLQLARRWAADLFAVAAEEMLHLAQVWNLLAAVGGTPYFWRPEFPVSSRFYPTGLPICLSAFSVPTLERFIQYELPDDEQRRAICQKHRVRPVRGAGQYGSVAELYTIVRQMIQAVPEDELFIGMKSRQVDAGLVDFPTLIRVVDRSSAVAAIDLIKEQGEGREIDDDVPGDLEQLDVDRDGHYGVFVRVLEEYRAELERAGEGETLVRDVVENPLASQRPDSSLTIVTTAADQLVGQQIQDPYTLQVARLFDRVYLLMLRLLQYVFRNATGECVVLREFAGLAIGLMPTLIKPLAESLTLLPMGGKFGDRTAGPSFGMSRHVTLPDPPQVAAVVVRERLAELVAAAEQLAADERAPVQLENAARNMRRWLSQLEFHHLVATG